MQGKINSVFSSRQVKLHTTLKPVTPFGGLVSLIEFFNTLKLGEVLGRLMPLRYSSPNAIAPEQTLFALIISIIAGAQRLAHTDWLRADRALHALLGIERFPGTDTVRNLLKRFTQPVIEAFWRPLWRWLLLQGWARPADGWSLDLDSTVFQRSGHQEGALRGYNPSRPGRHTHHPLLAVLAEAPLVSASCNATQPSVSRWSDPGQPGEEARALHRPKLGWCRQAQAPHRQGVGVAETNFAEVAS